METGRVHGPTDTSEKQGSTGIFLFHIVAGCPPRQRETSVAVFSARPMLVQGCVEEISESHSYFREYVKGIFHLLRLLSICSSLSSLSDWPFSLLKCWHGSFAISVRE